MKLHDSIVAAVFLVLAIAVVAGAQAFPPAPGQPVGPALFPTAVGICLGVASVVLLVHSLAPSGPRVWAAWSPDLRRPRTLIGFLLAPAAVVFYLAASESIGFLPCSVVILIALFTAYGVRFRLGLPLAIVGSLVIYALFSRLLSVPLPAGLLEGFV
jgi:putative tricarboxylic transport membrane protein